MLPKVLHNWLLNARKISVGALRCDRGKLSFTNVVEDMTLMVDTWITITLLKYLPSTCAIMCKGGTL